MNLLIGVRVHKLFASGKFTTHMDLFLICLIYMTAYFFSAFVLSRIYIIKKNYKCLIHILRTLDCPTDPFILCGYIGKERGPFDLPPYPLKVILFFVKNLAYSKLVSFCPLQADRTWLVAHVRLSCLAEVTRVIATRNGSLIIYKVVICKSFLIY